MWYDIQGWFGPRAVEEYGKIVRRYPGGNFVEVGIWKGKSFASVMPVLLELNYQNIYAVDHFLGQPDLRDTVHSDASKLDLYQIFTDNMSKLGYNGKYKVLKMNSVEAAGQFLDNSLDVVFIDADHSYEAFNADLGAWIPKIKSGGTICGHDYPGWPGVVQGLTERFGSQFNGLPDGLWEMIL